MDTLTIHLDGAKMRTLRALYPRIAKALFFPEYFGKNLDALFDCLCDLSEIDRKYKKVEITIGQSALFLSKEKAEKKAAALQVLHDACLTDNRYDERTLLFKFD